MTIEIQLQTFGEKMAAFTKILDDVSDAMSDFNAALEPTNNSGDALVRRLTTFGETMQHASAQASELASLLAATTSEDVRRVNRVK